MSYDDDPDDKPVKEKDGGPIDRKEFQSMVKGMLVDASKYCDDELSPERARATDYYLGKPFGNEEEGRSQIVLTEVKDGVLAVLPSLLRTFFGAERAVEFIPKRADAVAVAEQASDYVQHVFAEENRGFLLSYFAMKDALVRKLGIVKWWWDDSAKKVSHRNENVTQSELEALVADDANDLTLATETSPAVAAVPPTPPDPTTGNPGNPGTPGVEALHTIEYTRTEKDGRVCLAAVPPNEIIFSREARSQDDAICLTHRTEKSKSDLLSMGISKKLVEAHAGKSATLKQNVEELARSRVSSSGQQDDVEAGEANDKTLYCEAFMRVDVDGDGIVELRKVCTIGDDFFIVNGEGLGEPVDEVPFAIVCPDPEPHTMSGLSHADSLMDLQRVKSFVLRSTLDSLALSIYPRTAYIEGQANVQDILNTEIGAPIRTRSQNAVTPFAHPFTGQQAMPIFPLLDEIGERRTGRDLGAMGLDADALQSSTASAVGAAVSAAQERGEMLARVFAEMLYKPLFRGIYRMIVRYRPKAKMIRLRGTWTEVDPAVWDADMDVTVNVALGSTLKEQKLAVLAGIAEKQEQLLQLLGPDNPVSSLAQYATTLRDAAIISGFKDPSRYFKEVDPNWQPPQQPPQKTPEQTLAEAQLQVEQMRTQRELAIKEAELQLKKLEQDREFEFKKYQSAMDDTLKRYEINARYGAANTELDAEMDARAGEAYLEHTRQSRAQELDTATAAHSSALAQQKQLHDQALARQQQSHEQELANSEQEHSQKMAERSAAVDEAAAAQPQGSE